MKFARADRDYMYDTFLLRHRRSCSFYATGESEAVQIVDDNE